jgi:hypothetical protein
MSVSGSYWDDLPPEIQREILAYKQLAEDKAAHKVKLDKVNWDLRWVTRSLKLWCDCPPSNKPIKWSVMTNFEFKIMAYLQDINTNALFWRVAIRTKTIGVANVGVEDELLHNWDDHYL